MTNKYWSCTLPILLTAFAISFGLSTISAKAETKTQTKTQPQSNPLSPAIPSASSQSLSKDATTITASVLKVGETRSQWMARSQDDAIAKIFPHKLDGRDAATVYVRNIPVLTFVRFEGEARAEQAKSQKAASLSVKLPSPLDSQANLDGSRDPQERATAAAALINRLNRDKIDANIITPEWKSGSYMIKFGDQANIKFDRGLMLPNTTKDQVEDVLQAANLLRRLMGDAPPVNTVTNAPQPVAAASMNIFAKATQALSGLASWYGPGFEGNFSASGEAFNAYALTAAHRTLPFGTKVRVTNVDTGQSVVVRINDRGPFEYSRVIDISKGAAQLIGLISAGVAPVKLEIVND